MAFVDLLFDPRISYHSVGGPQYSTTIVQSLSGREQRNQNWAQPVSQWDVSYGVKTLADIRYIQNFFIGMKGRFNTFRFYNQLDNALTNENLGNGNGAIGQTLQLQKTYTDLGGNTYIKTITKPVKVAEADHTLGLTSPVYTTFALKCGTATLVEGVNYSVNYSTGLITSIIAFTNGQAMTVSCSFHYHVRFNSDSISISTPSKGAYSVESINIVEVKDDL